MNRNELVLNNDEEIQEKEQQGRRLFQGDTGELPYETRRVLVQLLKGPSLDGRRYSKLWPILLRDEYVIRSRLNELFLSLLIDKNLLVAFTQQADIGDLESPHLLKRAQLTFIDSVLLLYLRQRLTQSENQGERAVISLEEIKDFLEPYKKTVTTDQAGFVKRVQAAVEKTKKYGILQKLVSSEGRFEISPTLKILFSAEQVQALTKLYENMIADGESEKEI